MANGDDQSCTRLLGYCNDFVSLRSLEQTRYVSVLDMPPIFAEMERQPMRSGFQALESPGHRIGEGLTPRLAQGGDVVDVDVQTGHGGGVRGGLGPMVLDRGGLSPAAKYVL